MQFFKKKQKVNIEKEIEKQTTRASEIANKISDLREETNKIIGYLNNNAQKIKNTPEMLVQEQPKINNDSKTINDEFIVKISANHEMLKLRLANISNLIKELDKEIDLISCCFDSKNE